MNAIPYGPDAVLLRFADRADATAFQLSCRWMTELERDPPEGLCEIVPAFTTLLLVFAPGSASNALERFRNFEMPQSSNDSRVPKGCLVELPVHYDGPDLVRVAEHAGLAIEDVIQLHSEPEYCVHCLGFSPGFPYLGGLDRRLHTPRLHSPRPRVPAGSVAIGGEHTGIYSVASPGGWNLIGTTPEPLFNPQASEFEQMFRVRAGDRVRFRSVPRPSDALGLVSPKPPPTEVPVPPNSVAMLQVSQVGVGLTIQDFGRPGFGRFGIPPGGAMDPAAAAWANRLLDNPPNAPVLEFCLQGQRLVALRDGWIAVTGSDQLRTTARPAWSAFRVRAGETLEFPPGSYGVWSYLAIPGGLAAPRFLGSASVNSRVGVGMALRPGTILGFENPTAFDLPPAAATRRVPWTDVPDPGRATCLRVWPGPQWGCFCESDRQRFFETKWVVGSQCDRVGYRLTGPSLSAEPAEIISEPVLPGTIQIPAGGQPIVTMPDGPTLGGYPKFGWIAPGDLARLAQTRSGQMVQFELKA